MVNKLVFIQTDGGAEAVFLNDHMIACFENDGFSEPVSYIAAELEIALNITREDFTVKHPEDEWSWNDLYEQVERLRHVDDARG
ncbi:hypothetical protein JZA95_004593 [Salmonella enterica subsp. enterica serovar Anatum]|uniref:Uncharacterized protein n=4 Tax=Salmonella enterica TaxID=28901 RepID=A0A5U0LST1_SALER|nr:hypothetical protein [Salmonella enterica subsp. enterica serovar Saintpaul]EAB1831107.1 hypothetical protein [Salmonella enterica]EAC1927665.1 hypothetical protein [Salmonella enterica subsp. enterica serovar Anatum]EAM7841768.1 hypothetical protein [Salmonella enterica subsp. enterica]EAP3003205.1 hypothetical protein [Salmonella enterica subsp. enterica serovar Johannesburg]EBE0761274.1 hypothetical protein [Salmonella enterica subsp. enterica serovar Eko]EBO6127039.1 hypothetical prote